LKVGFNKIILKLKTVERKKKILVFSDWYLPGYKAGGPIQSVANIVGHLKNDFDFHIVTSDRDLHSNTPYENTNVDSWNKMPDGSSVFYFSPENQTKKNLEKIILDSQADVIYLNSLFSKFFTIYPLLIRNKLLPSRKVVLAPRGMLGKGALDIKPAKKKLFLLGSRLTGLYSTIRWHASSDLEEKEIKNTFGKSAKVQVALNLTAPRTLQTEQREKSINKLKAVFISRISTKKNLDGTLKLLAKIPENYSIAFDIYGPIEDETYWNQCKALIESMPKHIKVNYKGAIKNEEVVSALQKYHLSILLTFNENFGHSIVESMAAGCMVLLSDQTPWKNLAIKKVGWDLANENIIGIQDAIIACSKMNQIEFNESSDAALAYASEIINNPTSIAQNKALFN